MSTNVNFFSDDIKTVAELNKVRSELMIEMNSQYNKKQKELLEGAKSFKRINFIKTTSIEVKEAEVFAPFVLVSERTQEAKVIFNDDGTVKH